MLKKENGLAKTGKRQKLRKEKLWGTTCSTYDENSNEKMI